MRMLWKAWQLKNLCLTLSSAPSLETHDLARMDVFTDGACMLPSCKRCRLSSFAALACKDDRVFPVVAGHLPGLHQGIFRAELLAVCSVLQVARASSDSFRIWSDCLGVVKKVRGLQSSCFPPRAMGPKGDIWLRIWDAIQDLPVEFTTNHVPSHQNPLEFDDPAQSWAVQMNGEVDELAGRTLYSRDDQFWEVWQRYRTHHVAELRAHKQVTDFHIQVAEVFSRNPPTVPRRGAVVIRGDRPFTWPIPLPGPYICWNVGLRAG